MTTVFLDAVFKSFFKIVHDTGQQLTIDRTNFLTDGFLQIIQRTGFVSVNTRFEIPPPQKKITRWKIGRARGPRHGCPGNMFRTMVIDSFAVCAVEPSCWNHTLAHFILLRRSSEYYPFKRCQVPVGHPVFSGVLPPGRQIYLWRSAWIKDTFWEDEKTLCILHSNPSVHKGSV